MLAGQAGCKNIGLWKAESHYMKGIAEEGAAGIAFNSESSCRQIWLLRRYFLTPGADTPVFLLHHCGESHDTCVGEWSAILSVIFLPAKTSAKICLSKNSKSGNESGRILASYQHEG